MICATYCKTENKEVTTKMVWWTLCARNCGLAHRRGDLLAQARSNGNKLEQQGWVQPISVEEEEEDEYTEASLD